MNRTVSRTARLGLLLGLVAFCAAALAQPEPAAQPDAAGTDPVAATTTPEDGTAEAAQDEESAAPAEGEEAGTAEEEFKPSEEISEDYAVPLPSDI